MKWIFLYRASLVLLLFIFIGLLVVTPIDTILQSQSSGQFWNVLIIVAAYALTGFVAVVLYSFRLFKMKRSMAEIPKRYIPRKDDLSKESADYIERELDRCWSILQQTSPENTNQRISHPGLMHPKLSEGLFSAPYYQVIQMLNTFVEYKTQALHPSFVRRKGMPLREYVLWLNQQDLIESDDRDTIVDDFIQVYERARFSGKLIHEDQFDDYMEKCFRLLFAIKTPEYSSNIEEQQQEQNGNQAILKDPFRKSYLNVKHSLGNNGQDELNRQLQIARFNSALSPFTSHISNISRPSFESDNGSVIVHRAGEVEEEGQGAQRS